MHGPSLRGITVTAGVVGVVLIVAGAATAMAHTAPDVPVATAIQLEVDPETSVGPVTADAPAAQAVEVGRGPIECTASGSCGDDGSSAVTVAVDEPDPAPAPAVASPSTSASTSAPAAPPAVPDCAFPPGPDRPAGSSKEAWHDTIRGWLDAAVTIADECDMTWDEAREAARVAWPEAWEGSRNGRWDDDVADAWAAWTAAWKRENHAGASTGAPDTSWGDKSWDAQAEPDDHKPTWGSGG